MKKIIGVVLAFMSLIIGTSGARAASIALFDWGIHVAGTTYCDLGPCDFDVWTGHLSGPDGLPTSIDISGFDFGTGLGSIVVTFDPGVAGTYFIGAFFDHEIDEASNTYFNEFGAASGTSGAGQSWEIDEPGFVFGDIFANFTAGTLDNSNSVPAALPDDVSMAMGWDFSLADGEFATIGFTVSDTLSTMLVPPEFFLSHTDPDSRGNPTIYLSSNLEVVPESGTVILMGSGLIGLFILGKTRVQRRVL